MPKTKPNNSERTLAEKKVNLAINMSDVCVRVSFDSIRDRNPRIKKKEVLKLMRKRIMYGRN